MVIHNYGNPYEKWKIFVARPLFVGTTWHRYGAKFIHVEYSYLLIACRHMDQRIIDAAIRQWRVAYIFFVHALKPKADTLNTHLSH